MSDVVIIAVFAIVAVTCVALLATRSRHGQRQQMTKDRRDVPVLRQPLSAREREVAALAAKGLTNKQIAAQLHLSATTVRNHLTSTYGKLGVTGRDDLSANPHLGGNSRQAPDRDD